MKTITLALISVLLITLIPIVNAENKTVCIYFFYGETCPHCAQEKPFLSRLEEKYSLEVHSFEVYFNKENQKLFENIAKAYGTTASGVPTTFIGEKVFVGYTEGDSEIYDSRTHAYVGYNKVIEKIIKQYAECCGAKCPSTNITIINSNESQIGSSELPFTPINTSSADSSVSSNRTINMAYVVGVIFFGIIVCVFVIRARIKKG